MSGRDPEFDAISEKEIWEEARDRLKIAMDADSHNRQAAKEDILFCEGDQWDDPVATTFEMETPEIVVNHTDALVRRVVNNMKQQRPRGKAHPVGDGASIEIAETINGIGRHVEYRSEASVAYDTAGEFAVKAGWGWCRIIPEYVAPDSFQRDLRILPIRNLFTVFCDPSAQMPTASDMGWALISVKMKKTEFRRLHPKLEISSWTGEGLDEWDTEEEIRLAEYFRIREKAEKLHLIRGDQGEEFTRWDSELPKPESLAAAGLRIVDSRTSSRRRVEWFKLNGTRVVQREVLPGSWIPLFRCEGNAVDVDGKIYRRGMVRAMQDPARMVNYGEVAKIKRLGLSPKAPWVGAEGQFDGHPEWDDANLKSYSKLVYKPVTVMTGQGEVPLPPPQRLQPAQVEAGFAEFTMAMKSNLLAVAGMPNDPGQDVQGQVISGKALQKRQALSDQSHFQYYDNQTLMIAQIWRVMLEWIPHYFSEERLQRIVGEDGVPSMITVNQREVSEGVRRVKNDLSVGRYDVVMDTGPGYETKRQEGSEALLELAGSQTLGPIIAKVGADLLVRGIDAPYMQELADRLAAQTPEGLKKIMEGMPQRAKSLIEAMANENAQLKQALQAAQLENKVGLAKAHLQAQTKAHDTEVKAETSKFDTIVDSKTKLAVAEIQAGASLLNTHAEARHHKEEAERMIEQAASTEKAN